MATLQLEDLLRDDLAGDQPIASWETALTAVFLQVDPSSLSKVLLVELQTLVPKAAKNLRSMIDRAAETGELASIDSNGDLERLYSRLASMHPALNEGLAKGHCSTPDLSEMYVGLQEEIDEQVFQAMSRQDRFFHALNDQIDELDLEVRKELRVVLADLDRGLSELGHPRIESLRAARTRAKSIADEINGGELAVAVFLEAVAHWKLTRSQEDCHRLLRRAWIRVEFEPGPVTHFLGWMLGNLSLLQDDPVTGWLPMLAAAESEKDPKTILDAAILAVQLRKWETARELVERGIQSSNLFVIHLLANPVFDEVVGDVIASLVDLQCSARRNASRELGLWSSDLHRIRSAEKAGHLSFDFLELFEHERRTIAPRILDADLFTATNLYRSARRSRHEVGRLASQLVSQRHAEARSLLEAAREELVHAWGERDATIEQATAGHQAAVQESRESLREALEGSEKSQNGCALGMGSGCGAFLLYLALAAFLATQGVQAGFGTLFGWFGLTASGIPIAASVMAQLTFGFQRVALDKVLHDRIRAAQSAYEVAAQHADRIYREQSLAIKESLFGLEANVRICEESLKILHAAG
ncbi:MAG: hypothetical protein IT203_03315 [Fimbriimonadaceae bacterium]|nr:hypothetical protein [Fimbriimonadaceae bacterium]